MTATASQTGTTFDPATAAAMTEVVVTAILDVRTYTGLDTYESQDLVAREFGDRAARDGGRDFGIAVEDFVRRIGAEMVRQDTVAQLTDVLAEQVPARTGRRPSTRRPAAHRRDR